MVFEGAFPGGGMQSGGDVPALAVLLELVLTKGVGLLYTSVYLGTKAIWWRNATTRSASWCGRCWTAG